MNELCLRHVSIVEKLSMFDFKLASEPEYSVERTHFLVKTGILVDLINKLSTIMCPLKHKAFCWDCFYEAVRKLAHSDLLLVP